ncbi:carboxypeptidase-like regulatory domain-containing protein [Xanthocytophaga agilis]|uniref:Carboxypeptidase-like regulatory domain-containing protein n=1 Tax=Xanthocytophaga agilis TaxID=3048010 RepID=A0AAE3RCY6_9BACT|nr:carboxypeptidase-like regulatory domain-containing protein [Xanthocytophaga agilis]MDJ1505597.1 carboxypeptidase-like regulatory domain-containing protein [Xanthocytophaga agilis]
MKKIYILFGLLMLVSCKPLESRIVGRYWHYADFEFHTKITLHPDHRFVFEGQEGLQFLKTQGSWEVKGHQLILNSDPELFLSRESTVVEQGISATKTFSVRVLDQDAAALPGASIQMTHQGQITGRAGDTSGEGLFPLADYDSLQVSFIGYKELTVKLPDKTINSITVQLALDDLQGSVKFKNEKWQVKSGSLFDPRFKSRKWKNRYKKVD